MIRCQECIFFYPTCTCRRFPLKELCSRSEWQKKKKEGAISILLFLSLTDEIRSKENQEQHKQTLLTMWYRRLNTTFMSFIGLFGVVRLWESWCFWIPVINSGSQQVCESLRRDMKERCATTPKCGISSCSRPQEGGGGAGGGVGN